VNIIGTGDPSPIPGDQHAVSQHPQDKPWLPLTSAALPHAGREFRSVGVDHWPRMMPWEKWMSRPIFLSQSCPFWLTSIRPDQRVIVRKLLWKAPLTFL